MKQQQWIIKAPEAAAVTEKLYYIDSRECSFTGTVLSCRADKGRWAVVLDRSAFFPEGGGQPGDRGTLGSARVLDVHERDGEIIHFCDAPLEEGAAVKGMVDADLRFARKQIHSAEHIVSGTAHREWGCENVGFHMTESSAVIDFDRELDEEQLRTLERLANETVWADLPINILYPSAEELAAIPFRQKKELSGQIRLVEIPGVDVCACCAPHAERTGQIGLIRFLDAMRHRGGVRITMTAGRAAYEDAAGDFARAVSLSRLFSVPREDILRGAERLAAEAEARKEQAAALEQMYTALLARATEPKSGRIAEFLPGEFSSAAMRSLAGALLEKCSLAGVFAGEDGAYRYVLSGREGDDLRPFGKTFNTALRGRGGGSARMLQGSVSASKEEIEAFFYAGARQPRTE